MFRTYLKFRCSKLDDSNCRRTLSIVALTENKEPMSNDKVKTPEIGSHIQLLV